MHRQDASTGEGKEIGKERAHALFGALRLVSKNRDGEAMGELTRYTGAGRETH